MADNDDVPGSPAPVTSEQPVAAPGPAVAVAQTRWRDRVWSFRAMIAVAVASLIIGGIGGGLVGGVLGFVVGHHVDRSEMGPWGPGMHGPGMHGPKWRERGHGGGPGWRWDDGGPQGPLTPYGGPSAPNPTPTPSSTPSPGSTG
jgi:hypothetical protein